MRYKTLTRLLVKLLGIYFLLNGCIGLVGAMIFLLMSLSEYGSYGGLSLIAYPVAWCISASGSIGIGLLLLLGSNWVVDKLIPSNRPYCPNCGYELTGMVGQHCPECGVDLQGLRLVPQR